MNFSLKIRKLVLSNYRNHEYLKIEIKKKIIFINGKNGSGKTNILEAISLLFSNTGFRNAKLENIPKSSDIFKTPLFGANFTFTNNVEDIKVGISFIKKKEKYNKIIKFDTSAINIKTFITKFKLFSVLPSIGNFFLGNSLQRRDFLDSMIFIENPSHQETLMKYNKLQLERIKILKLKKKNNYNEKWLLSIEKQMSRLGIIICDNRRILLKKINHLSLKYSDQFPILKLSLSGQLDSKLINSPALEVEEYFLKKLTNNREIDRLVGKTQFSANKTDILIFNHKKNDYVSNCSTGEQKVTLIIILFLFLKIIKESKKSFICLLDDIFSTLDEKYVELILKEIVSLESQTWITGVDASFLKNNSKYLKEVMFVNL